MPRGGRREGAPIRPARAGDHLEHSAVVEEEAPGGLRGGRHLLHELLDAGHRAQLGALLLGTSTSLSITTKVAARRTCATRSRPTGAGPRPADGELRPEVLDMKPNLLPQLGELRLLRQAPIPAALDVGDDVAAVGDDAQVAEVLFAQRSD